jgi:hypothetical protein
MMGWISAKIRAFCSASSWRFVWYQEGPDGGGTEESLHNEPGDGERVVVVLRL